MRGNGAITAYAALAVAATLVATTLSACGTIDRVRGKVGASTEVEARNMAPQDPMARPVQVAWTSARAVHCGFVFNPSQLRSDYLAAEVQAGNSPQRMEQITKAYDYTFDSVTRTIQDNLNYCNKDRTAAIRKDLNRYLAGDYTPSARMAE
jgi:hypothetical protein